MITEEEKAQMIEMYSNGLTLSEISKILKRSPPSISFWLRRFGIKTLTKQDRWNVKTKERRRLIVKFLLEDPYLSSVELSKKVKLSCITIRKYRRELEEKGLIKRVHKNQIISESHKRRWKKVKENEEKIE